MSATLLDVANLHLSIPVPGGTLHALRGIDLTLAAGETLGIVGESGSGKSLTALSIVGLHPRHATRSADRIRIGDDDVLAMDERSLARTVRGSRAAMIFQDPMSSLNPVMTVGRQLTEVLTAHAQGTEEAARAKAIALMEQVGIAGAADRIRQYPHQFSGGQRQRIMIAMALMADPMLLIADEPTTALDVTVQVEILRMLAVLQKQRGLGLILVTHNLGVVSRIADRTAVMYAGEVVEEGPTADVVGSPRHPYTQGLLRAMPGTVRRGGRLGTIAGIVPSLLSLPKGCAFAARCALAEDRCHVRPPPVHRAATGQAHRCVHMDPQLANDVGARLPAVAIEASAGQAIVASGVSQTFRVRRGLFAPVRTLHAVSDVDLTVREGETLAIVGESGCGKSTLGFMLAGLKVPQTGGVTVDGQHLPAMDRLARARLIQPVFQDPMASLNPRQSVLEAVTRPLEIHGLSTAASREATARQLLQEVGLPPRLAFTYPGQLSGGQRQRVAIARALALEPRILVCDEPTSALDVSVQAQILNLLRDLAMSRRLTLVLISHDLSVVAHMADRVAVMYLGRIVELGDTQHLLTAPRHPYTRALLAASLSVDPGAGLPPRSTRPGFGNALDVPTGCAFHPRCTLEVAQCRSERPLLRAFGGDQVACHRAGETVREAEHGTQMA
jgi:peptide/nickel transport system ATP-binding protein